MSLKFLYIPILGCFFMLSCKKDETEQPTGNKASAEYYFKGTVDNAAKSYYDKVNNYMISCSMRYGLNGIEGDTVFSYESMLISPFQPGTESIRVGIEFRAEKGTDHITVLDQLFSQKIGRFKGYISDTIPGIYVGWKDGKGRNIGSIGGDQNGSSFTITEVTSFTESGKKAWKVKGALSCKLYNGPFLGSTDTSAVIVNGSFTLKFTQPVK